MSTDSILLAYEDHLPISHIFSSIWISKLSGHNNVLCVYEMQTTSDPASYAIFKSFHDLVPLRGRFSRKVMKFNIQGSSLAQISSKALGRAPSTVFTASYVKLTKSKLFFLIT